MSETDKNQYQRDGYETDGLSVNSITWWSTHNFSGELEKALEFCLTDIEDLRDIKALKEAYRWLKDHSSG